MCCENEGRASHGRECGQRSFVWLVILFEEPNHTRDPPKRPNCALQLRFDSQCEQQMEIPLEFGEEDSYIFHTWYGNTRSRH